MNELSQEVIDRAKAIQLRFQRVLQHRIEGLTVKQSAERLGVSESTIERARRELGITTGRAWRDGTKESKPMGRTREARP